MWGRASRALRHPLPLTGAVLHLGLAYLLLCQMWGASLPFVCLLSGSFFCLIAGTFLRAPQPRAQGRGPLAGARGGGRAEGAGRDSRSACPPCPLLFAHVAEWLLRRVFPRIRFVPPPRVAAGSAPAAACGGRAKLCFAPGPGRAPPPAPPGCTVEFPAPPQEIAVEGA